MEKTYQFKDSDKTYQVKSNVDFVKQVKNGSAHTKDLSIEAYIAQQLEVMTNLWDADLPGEKTADLLVNAWLDHDLVVEVNKSNSARPR